MPRVVSAIILALLGSSLLLHTPPLVAKRFSEDAVVSSPPAATEVSSDPAVLSPTPPAPFSPIIPSADTVAPPVIESTWLTSITALFTPSLIGAWLLDQPATAWQLGDSLISALGLLLLGGIWWGGIWLSKRRRLIAASTTGHAPRPTVGPAADSEQDYEVPLWFDNASFVEGTKLLFVRLQEAWDRGDVRDIRNYTTPAGFAALQQQRAGLGTGAAPHLTDVINLTAELCSICHQDDEVLAWVRFHGLLQDQSTQITRPFAERWQVRHKSDSQLGEWWITAIAPDSLPPNT